MQKARRHYAEAQLRPLVSVWFQVLFHPLFRVLFTFPSRYLSTIGLSGVFSLARWCWQFQTGFHRPRPTQDTNRDNLLTCTGLSPSMVQLSRSLPLHALSLVSVLQPHSSLNYHGLGCSAFARHYLRNHSCFLFLRLLRCFSSPGLPHATGVVPCLQHGGLSHSEICGSHRNCQSPQLIAAYHVLHRL
jgi:hypothetical protein